MRLTFAKKGAERKKGEVARSLVPEYTGMSGNRKTDITAASK